MTRSVTTSNPPPSILPNDALGQDTGRKRIPFTVIDQAVHVLDTPSEPWSIQLELGLRGHLDEERLAAGVRAGMQRHPMTRARQLPARSGDRNWWWEIVPEADLDPLRVLECPDDQALAFARAELFSRSVPLVEAPPFRLWLARHPAGDRLLLNANHAAFDAFGCVRLVGSVAREYSGEPDPLPDIDLDQARDVDSLLGPEESKVRGRRSHMLTSKLSDLFRPPAHLAPEGGTDVPGYGFHHVVLSPELTARLDQESGPTVNDLLLAALHLSVEAWNASHGEGTGRVSVLVPVNLRPKEWREEVVTNFVLDARVATSSADRAEPAALLDAIGTQSEQIKEGGGAALMEVLRGWEGLPVWAKQPLSPAVSVAGKAVDTAVLSNLGVLREPPRYGDDGETVEAFFSAPTRMPCGLSLGAVTVGDRLHLSFRFRRPQFGLDAAQRFAARFVAELERVAGS